MAQILDGKLLAQKLKSQLKTEVEQLKKDWGSVPRLVNILVGTDPGSCAYATSQQKTAAAIGIDYELKALGADTTQEDLVDIVSAFNEDASVHGIMVHKPVPRHIQYAAIANVIDTDKDLEGINVANIGKMLLGKTAMIPCTPAAVMEHIKSTGVPLRGKEAVLVGASEIVGKPLSLLLLEQYVTLTICHIGTSEAGALADHVRQADILVVAVGKPSVVKGDWVKEKAVVIDVGINQIDGKIVGDVEFEKAKKRAAFITPVPGGVGPVTVVMLMRNGLEAFKIQNQKKEDSKV